MTLTGTSFMAAGIAQILRGIYFYVRQPLPDLFAPSHVNAAVFVGISLAVLGWSFGFFMMTNERLLADLRTVDAGTDAVALKTSRSDTALGANVPEPEVRLQLKKIMESDVFRRSVRMERFLTLAVERVFTGHPEQLKEYALGRDVFNRDENYDPRIDSIVRVEAQRLRRKLHEYYETYGRNDPVILELPPGGYIPLFRYRVPKGAASSHST